VTSQNAPVGDLTGRLVVVTGASSGVGLAAAVDMARRGATPVLVGRDPGRLTAAADRVREAAGGRPPAAYRADFTRLDDVHVLVDHLRQRYERIHVLANNAGGIIGRRQTTVDGFEATIQTNHLAGFLLANLLREQLRGGRIITTASDAHRSGGLDPADLNGEARRFQAMRAYSASKQANILFAAEAARRWPDILSASFHPGVVRSNFGSGTLIGPFFKFAPFLVTPEQGADTLVWLASTPPPQLRTGAYYIKRQVRRPSSSAGDQALAARLWDASLNAVGLGWER
jgi:daunorubicin C-13 ketoreductase